MEFSSNRSCFLSIPKMFDMNAKAARTYLMKILYPSRQLVDHMNTLGELFAHVRYLVLVIVRVFFL